MNNYNKLFDSSFFSTPKKNEKENIEQKVFNPSQGIFGNSGVPINTSNLNPGGSSNMTNNSVVGQNSFGVPALPQSSGFGGSFGTGVFGNTTSNFGMSNSSALPINNNTGFGTNTVQNNTGSPAFGSGSLSFGTNLNNNNTGFGSNFSTSGNIFGSASNNSGQALNASKPLNSSFSSNYNFNSGNGVTGNSFTNSQKNVSGLQSNLSSSPFGTTPVQPSGSIFGSSAGASNPFGTSTPTTNSFSSSPFSMAGVNSFQRSTTSGFPGVGLGQNTSFGQTSASPLSTAYGSSTTTSPLNLGTSSPFTSSPGAQAFSSPQSLTAEKPFGIFGSGLSKGTKDCKYQDSRVREDTSFVNLKDICGMKEYQSKNVSELRVEDYSLGRKAFSEQPQNTSFVAPIQESKPLFQQEQRNPSVMPSFSTSQPSAFPQTSSIQPPQTSSNFLSAQPSQLFQQSQPTILHPQQSVFPSAQVGKPFMAPTQLSFPHAQSAPIVQTQNTTFLNSTSNADDPFLMNEIKIDKVEAPVLPIKKKIPKPIFKREELEQTMKIALREPSLKPEIETIPSQEDIKKTESTNLVIIFKEGRIEYLEPIKSRDALISNIELKVFFNKDEVSVNDMVGMGLNKRARVYVYNYFPFSKKEGSFIKSEALIYELKKNTKRKFIEYDKDSGIYVYELNHF